MNMAANSLFLLITGPLPVIVKRLCMEANPGKFISAQGNCCRQMAVTVAYILDRLAGGHYHVRYREVMATDRTLPVHLQRFDHAHTIAIPKDGHGSGVFIDLCWHRGRIFEQTRLYEYPKARLTDITIDSIKEVPWSPLLDQPEWYTGDLGIKLSCAAMHELIGVAGKVGIRI